MPTLRVLLANGNKQVMGEDTRQQIGRQNSRHGPLGNDLRLLTRSQSQVASEVRSRPTIADKSKIEEVTKGQREADGAEVGVNRSFTQQRRFGEKNMKRVTMTSISNKK